MRPVFEKAKKNTKRLVYAEGEHDRILRTVQSVVDEGLAIPVLIGREDVIDAKISKLNLRLDLEKDIEIVKPSDSESTKENINTLQAARMVKNGGVDGLICGTVGRYHEHLKYVTDEFGIRDDVSQSAAMNVVMLKKGIIFICDTAVTNNPDAEQLAQIALLATEGVKRFGITPRAALLSFSNNGHADSATAEKMNRALELIKKRDPELEIDGQMRADAALVETIRNRVLPDSSLKESANLLIMPNLDAAKIAYDLVKVLGEGTSIGPILLGLNYPAHILTPSSSVRRIVNASALAAVDAQICQLKTDTNDLKRFA